MGCDVGAGEEPERRLDRVLLGPEEAPADRLAATAAELAAEGLRVVVTGTDEAVLAAVRDRLGATSPASEPAARPTVPEYGWLPLPVRGDLPVTAAELHRLVRLHARQTPEHDRRRRQAFPPEESVPTDDEVRALADPVVRSDLAARQLEPRLRDVLDRPDAGEVLAVLQEVKERLGEVLRHRRAWVVKIADLALGDPGGAAWHRLADQIDSIERLLETAAGLGDTVVEGVESSEEALQAFTALQDELDSGQSARRWFRGKTQRTAARLVESVLVDGEPVTDAAGASAVRRFLQVAAHSAALEQELAPLGVPMPPGTPREEMVEGLAGVRDALRSIARLVEASRRLADVLGPGPESPLPVASLEQAERVEWAGDALAAVREGEAARRDLEAAARTLEQSAARVMAAEDLEQPAPEVAELALCLRAAADAAYAEWLVKMRAGRRARRLAVQREELVARLADGAPGLPALLEADATETTWAPRIARWPEAWESARTRTEGAGTTPARVVPIYELAGGPGAAGGLDVIDVVDVVVLHDPDGEHSGDRAILDLAPRTVVLAGAAGPREVVLALAARAPVSGAEVRAATGLSADRSRTLLKQLVDAGELVRTGATSATRWHRSDRRDGAES